MASKNESSLARKDAKTRGLKYYMGVECLRGHSGLRHVSTKCCVECASTRSEAFKIKCREVTRAKKACKFAIEALSYSVVGEIDGMSVASSRAAALALELPLYVGRNCVLGHRVRHISCNKCLECNRRELKIQRENNPGHKEGVLAWRKANPDRVYAAILRWQKSHPMEHRALARENWHRRRARKMAAPGSHTKDQANYILELQEGRCAYCGIEENLTIDHKIPLVRGGSNDISNLQWLCRSHNSKKHDQTDFEYRSAAGVPTLTPWDAPPFHLVLMAARANVLEAA